MADFVAVLKKTLDGLGETTPDVRAKVYDKARATIESKLAAINPPPPAAVADRQRKALEDAIATVEQDYNKSAQPLDPLAELENIFSSIDRNRTQQTHVRPATKTEPAAPAPRPQPAAPPRSEERPAQTSWQRPQPEVRQPEPQPAPTAKPDPVLPVSKPALEPVWPKPKTETKPSFDFEKATPPSSSGGPLAQAFEADKRLPDVHESLFSTQQPVEDGIADEHFEDIDEPEKKRNPGRIIAAVVALAVLGGGGYGIWLNRDAFKDMFGLNKTQTADTTTKPAEPPKPAQTPAPQPAAEANSSPTPAPAPTPENGEPQKFTQRLAPDGKETDPGRAGGAAAVGEGTSIVALTTPPPATPPAQTPPAGGQPATPAAQAPADPATAGAPTPPTPSATVTQPAIPVGQKAIYYEERTSSAEGSAQPGNIVWSLVQESPGGDAPPEPAIRAEVTVPGKDMQLRMTIRRNADQTLPASHIIEMIFLTPQGFEGGGIDNVLRIAMKTSEQEAGSPLIGVPAKIADGYFLVALNDTKADQDANLTLLRNQEWLDIPVIYKSGRRALITMEKGLPGDKVFDEALKAWQAKTSG